MNIFHLQVVSPDGIFFDGQVKQVSLRTIVGDIAILAGHIPYVTAIGMGECRVYTENTEQPRRAACIGGFINVSKELVLISATTFEWAEDIEYDRAIKAKERAEVMIASENADTHSIELAKLKLSRANVRRMVVDNNK